ncbi:hypothetical protein [Pedobacter mendelii]|nr:hypothetical protein [Pedobacter mendelii]
MYLENSDNQIPKNLINIITFNVRATRTIGDEGIIPWVNIGRGNEEILNLIDADKIIITESEITISIEYPLEEPVSFVLNSDAGFTRKQLLIEIREKYLALSKAKHFDVNTLDLISLDVYKTDTGQIELILELDI